MVQNRWHQQGRTWISWLACGAFDRSWYLAPWIKRREGPWFDRHVEILVVWFELTGNQDEAADGLVHRIDDTGLVATEPRDAVAIFISSRVLEMICSYEGNVRHLKHSKMHVVHRGRVNFLSSPLGLFSEALWNNGIFFQCRSDSN